MKNLDIEITEGMLKTQDGETLNYRIYSDGGINIEGLNMRENFDSVSAANAYIQAENISIIQQQTKTAVYYNQTKKETYEMGGIGSIQQAYDLYKFVCGRNNWNSATFTHDVIIRLK